MARLTWSKEPNAKGLARVSQGPRGAVLKADGKPVASVSARRVGWGREYSGWFWSCATDETLCISHRNTASDPVETIEEAKWDAENYIRKCLGMPEKRKL